MASSVSLELALLTTWYHRANNCTNGQIMKLLYFSTYVRNLSGWLIYISLRCTHYNKIENMTLSVLHVILFYYHSKSVLLLEYQMTTPDVDIQISGPRIGTFNMFNLKEATTRFLQERAIDEMSLDNQWFSFVSTVQKDLRFRKISASNLNRWTLPSRIKMVSMCPSFKTAMSSDLFIVLHLAMNADTIDKMCTDTISREEYSTSLVAGIWPINEFEAHISNYF